MKSTGTNILDEKYFNCIEGSNQKPTIEVQYLDDDDVWQTLDDVKSVDIQTQINDERKTVYGYIPPSGSLSLAMNNWNEKYTPGGTDSTNDIFTVGRKLRVKAKYEIGV